MTLCVKKWIVQGQKQMNRNPNETGEKRIKMLNYVGEGGFLWWWMLLGFCFIKILDSYRPPTPRCEIWLITSVIMTSLLWMPPAAQFHSFNFKVKTHVTPPPSPHSLYRLPVLITRLTGNRSMQPKRWDQSKRKLSSSSNTDTIVGIVVWHTVRLCSQSGEIKGKFREWFNVWG